MTYALRLRFHAYFTTNFDPSLHQAATRAQCQQAYRCYSSVGRAGLRRGGRGLLRAMNDSPSTRRTTRPTNGFSKNLENHAATVARFFMYYNSPTAGIRRCA
jgi:hypothetical protein